MVKQYLWCFAPNCKYGAANGPVKVLKSDAKKLLRWKLKSNPDCGKVCQKCYNEDLCARKAAEERLAASATRANAAALKDAGGSVQQQKPQHVMQKCHVVLRILILLSFLNKMKPLITWDFINSRLVSTAFKFGFYKNFHHRKSLWNSNKARRDT